MIPLSRSATTIALVAVVTAPVLLGPEAAAQTPPAADTSPSAGTGTGSSTPAPYTGGLPPNPGAGTPTGASTTSTTTTTTGPYGWSTNNPDPNSYLPSSSRPATDINQAPDSFDLSRGARSPGVMHGSPGVFVSPEESGPVAPDVYVVKSGDTLWGVCDRFLHNPWEWPRVWSYNPELQNPHWIYPGDQIRLSPGGDQARTERGLVGAPARIAEGGRLVARVRTVPHDTVFLRDQGYIDDDTKDVWGEVTGSPEDQLLLSEGDYAYLELASGHDVALGQELTVFRPVAVVPGKTSRGTLVSILGTAKVDQWDPKARIARARLTESLGIVERGVKVGPLVRPFDVVPPAQNRVELEAEIVASLYPNVIYGQNQVVFINRGSGDGLAPGNRLLALVQGDPYRKTLFGASDYAASAVEYPREGNARVITNGARGRGDDATYPLETIGEVRVLTVREHSAACIVTASSRELERGQKVFARRGY